jgi:hypothetical protein
LLKKKENLLKRFKKISKLGCYNKDHLIITTNKKMKLSGIGIFGTCSQGMVNVPTQVESNIRVIEGTPTKEITTLINENMTISPGSDESNCVINQYFKTPINISPFLNYTIIWTCNLSTYYFFGTDGIEKYDAENNLVIKFYKEGNGGILSTNPKQTGRGIIAEIHYIA